jgi:hypothetical protein
MLEVWSRFNGREMAVMKNYYSYLLRIWQTENSKNQAWLASLEDPHTRQIVNFTSLEQLFEFIKTQTHTREENPSDNAKPSGL